MNFATFERAQVAAFAYREARFTGNLDCMRAICFVLRNRVRNGWGDGTWLSVLESSHLSSACHNQGAELTTGNAIGGVALSSDRLLQLIVRDVDDIYLGQDRFDDSVRQIVCEDHKKPVLFYSFVAVKPRPWFVENIIQQPAEHPHIGNIGPVMLFR